MSILRWIIILFCIFRIGSANALASSHVNTTPKFKLEAIESPDTLGIFGLPSSGQLGISIDSFNFPTQDSCGALQYRIWCSHMDSLNYPDQSVDWQLPTDSFSGDSVLKYLPNEAIIYCDVLGNNLVSVIEARIYVINAEGKWDYCETTIIMVDSFLVCDQVHPGRIGGAIKNIDDRPLLGVDMKLVGGPNDLFCWNGQTDENSVFLFFVHPEYEWEVSGRKDDNYLNGVTANDISLLARHIAGEEMLLNPYKIFAADANGDLAIDARDLLIFRKLLLGIIDELVEVPPWKMIDANYDFLGWTDFTLPKSVREAEHIQLLPVIVNELETNFIGVKIGDLDGDATLGN